MRKIIMGRKRICSYENSKKQKYRKGSWTKEEDQKLFDHIKIHGEGSWNSLPKAAGLKRCGRSCRLRWMNYLKPDIKRGNFSLEEEDLIVKLHALLGNRWSLIAGRLPGRTDNEVKNYWNSNIKRKLINAGIDPNNHRIHQFNIHNNIDIGKDKEKSSDLSTKHKSHDDDDDDGGDETVSSTLKLRHQTTVVRPRPHPCPRPHPYLVKS